MINLNPSIVDQEHIRKLRRKRLFNFFILPIVILTLVGGFLLRTGFFNLLYRASYNANNYSSAKTYTDMQNLANIIEPYIIYFDRGNALYMGGDYSSAENEYRSALLENPPKSMLCKVYVNLSLSIEKQGDNEFDDKNYDNALILYNSAEAILYENNCAAKNNNEESKDSRAENARDRIINKRRRAISAINSMDESGDDNNNSDNNKNVSDDDLKNILDNQDQSKALDNIRNKLNASKGIGNSYSGSYEVSW